MTPAEGLASGPRSSAMRCRVTSSRSRRRT